MRELPPTLALNPEPHPLSREPPAVFSSAAYYRPWGWWTSHSSLKRIVYPVMKTMPGQSGTLQQPTSSQIPDSVSRVQRCTPALPILLQCSASDSSAICSPKQSNTTASTSLTLLFLTRQWSFHIPRIKSDEMALLKPVHSYTYFHAETMFNKLSPA